MVFLLRAERGGGGLRRSRKTEGAFCDALCVARDQAVGVSEEARCLGEAAVHLAISSGRLGVEVGGDHPVPGQGHEIELAAFKNQLCADCLHLKDIPFGLAQRRPMRLPVWRGLAVAGAFEVCELRGEKAEQLAQQGDGQRDDAGRFVVLAVILRGAHGRDYEAGSGRRRIWRALSPIFVG